MYMSAIALTLHTQNITYAYLVSISEPQITIHCFGMKLILPLFPHKNHRLHQKACTLVRGTNSCQIIWCPSSDSSLKIQLCSCYLNPFLKVWKELACNKPEQEAVQIFLCSSHHSSCWLFVKYQDKLHAQLC